MHLFDLRVGIKHFKTNARVAVAGAIVDERINAIGRVVRAGGVGQQRKKTAGRIRVAFCVARERIFPDRRVGAPIRCCAKARPLQQLCCVLPVVLNKSAAAPNAVFSDAAPEPVGSPLLKRSAPAPEAVLKLPLVLLKSEYQPTAVFATPVVRLKRAFCPSAVVKLG